MTVYANKIVSNVMILIYVVVENNSIFQSALDYIVADATRLLKLENALLMDYIHVMMLE